MILRLKRSPVLAQTSLPRMYHSDCQIDLDMFSWSYESQTDKCWNKRSTIPSREIPTAVHLLLPGEFAKHHLWGHQVHQLQVICCCQPVLFKTTKSFLKIFAFYIVMIVFWYQSAFFIVILTSNDYNIRVKM